MHLLCRYPYYSIRNNISIFNSWLQACIGSKRLLDDSNEYEVFKKGAQIPVMCPYFWKGPLPASHYPSINIAHHLLEFNRWLMKLNTTYILLFVSGSAQMRMQQSSPSGLSLLSQHRIQKLNAQREQMKSHHALKQRLPHKRWMFRAKPMKPPSMKKAALKKRMLEVGSRWKTRILFIQVTKLAKTTTHG